MATGFMLLYILASSDVTARIDMGYDVVVL